MITKGVLITAIFITSTAVQLISQIVVTRLFGASAGLDVFLAAVAVPTIIVTVIYATLNDSFLPLYGARKNSHPDAHEDYFISHFILLTGAAFVISSILSIASPWISQMLYETNSHINDMSIQIKDISVQMSYMFFSIPLAVVATLFGAYHYAHKHFIRFPVAQTVGSIANIVLIVLLAPRMGIWGLVVAFVMNILFQILLIVPKISWKLHINVAHLLTISAVWIPLIIANLAVRSDTLLIRSFGMHLGEGYLVYLNLISKILSLAAGVTTIGIQVLLLPHLIEFIANKDYDKTVSTVRKAKFSAIVLSAVMAMIVMLLAPPLITMMFVGGKFTAQDAEVTISLLPMFLIPAIGWGSVSIFFQPLLAMKKNIHLAVISVIAIAAAWTVTSVTEEWFGTFVAITSGLTVLFAVAMAGSEFVWQRSKHQIRSSA